MSAADEHRASVTQLLNDFTEQRIGASPALELASAATAYALLAIEARLGELVDIQRAKFHRELTGSGDEPMELWDMDGLVGKAFGLSAEGGAE